MSIATKNENRGDGTQRAQGETFAAEQGIDQGAAPNGPQIETSAQPEGISATATTRKPQFLQRRCPLCDKLYEHHTIASASHIPNSNHKIIVQGHLKLKAQGIVTLIQR